MVSGSIPADSPVQIFNVAALDPISLFECHLNAVLRQVGIIWGQKYRKVESRNGQVPIDITVPLPPIYSLMNTTLQDSNNLFAETFLRHLGKYAAVFGQDEVNCFYS